MKHLRHVEDRPLQSDAQGENPQHKQRQQRPQGHPHHQDEECRLDPAHLYAVRVLHRRGQVQADVDHRISTDCRAAEEIDHDPGQALHFELDRIDDRPADQQPNAKQQQHRDDRADQPVASLEAAHEERLVEALVCLAELTVGSVLIVI